MRTHGKNKKALRIKKVVLVGTHFCIVGERLDDDKLKF